MIRKGFLGVCLVCSTFFQLSIFQLNVYGEDQQKPMTDEMKIDETKTAVFAGGCFWCMEPPFDKTPGVLDTTSGYTGGATLNPTYSEVTGKSTGHYEAIQITYDPTKVSYEQLLDVYWHNIDPLDNTGQFCDKGPQYHSVIFVANEEERAIAEASLKKTQEKLKDQGTIATTILPKKPFYLAEDYHQNYYKKNPLRYKYYRHGCGRDKRLEKIWGPKF